MEVWDSLSWYCSSQESDCDQSDFVSSDGVDSELRLDKGDMETDSDVETGSLLSEADATDVTDSEYTSSEDDDDDEDDEFVEKQPPVFDRDDEAIMYRHPPVFVGPMSVLEESELPLVAGETVLLFATEDDMIEAARAIQAFLSTLMFVD